MKQKMILILLALVFFSCRKDKQPAASILSITPMKDGPGAVVTIKGKNFGTNTAYTIVTFNGITATITKLNDSVIIVNVPNGATTGRISITVNGRTTTSAQDFEILKGSWTKKADFPGVRRGDLIAFAINGKGYAGLGYDGGAFFADLYAYDPVTNNWTQKASMPAYGRGRLDAVVANGKAYLVGGQSNDPVPHFNETWEYDPVADKWTRKTDFPGTGRYAGKTIAVNNMVYYGLSGASSLEKDWWKYDPATDKWTQMNNPPTTTSGQEPANANSTKGYIMEWKGGNELFGWEYNPTNDTWKSVAALSDPALYSSIFAINEKIYLAGGLVSARCWEFDPVVNTWTQKTSMPFYKLNNAASFSINGKGYMVCGSPGNDAIDFLSQQLWEFNPQ